jgi:phosphate-selective porin
MIRSIAAAFAFSLAVAASAQAMPVAPAQHPQDTVIVREACSAGMHRVNGV